MYQYVSCLLIAGQVKLCSYLRGEKYVKWFTFEHLNWDLCNYPGALEKNKAKYFDISVLVWLSAVPHICILIKKTLLSNWTLHAGKLPKFNSPSLFHLCIRSNGVILQIDDLICCKATKGRLLLLHISRRKKSVIKTQIKRDTTETNTS